MNRIIDDSNYKRLLPTQIHLKRHEYWKNKILSIGDKLIEDMYEMDLSDVLSKYQLTEKDMALLVRFRFFSQYEIDQFGLRELEQLMPL